MYFPGSCEALWRRLLDEPDQQAVLKHGAAGKAEHVFAFSTVLLHEVTLLKRTGCLFSAHDDGGFLSVQSDDPVGPNIDLEKKMDVEKRCMGLNDYNGDMRKGGRGGNPYRPPVSKEAAPVDAGSYYDKVTPRCHLKVLCLMCLSHVLITFCLFLLFFISSCGSPCLLGLGLISPPPPTTQIGLPLAVAVTDLAFDQSGLVPRGGGSLLFVLTTHCLQAPFPLQPHYPL